LTKDFASIWGIFRNCGAGG